MAPYVTVYVRTPGGFCGPLSPVEIACDCLALLAKRAVWDVQEGRSNGSGAHPPNGRNMAFENSEIRDLIYVLNEEVPR